MASWCSNLNESEDLKKYLSPEKFQRLQEVLKIEVERHAQQIDTSASQCYEVGQLFDTEKNVGLQSPKLQISSTDIKKTRNNKDITIKSFNEEHPRIVYTYEAYREIVTYEACCRQKTILNTPFAHFIYSQVKGNTAEVIFHIDKQREEELKPLIKSMENRNIPDNVSIPNHVMYTVSGKLPDLYVDTDGQSLDRNEIATLRQFYSENFYQSLDEEFTLSVSVLPFNLGHYFSPIFQSLKKVNSITFADSSFKGIVDTITEQTIDLIIDTAKLIQSGDNNYLENNRFLQKLYKTFLLNEIKLANLFKTFQSAIDKGPSGQIDAGRNKAIAGVNSLIKTCFDKKTNAKPNEEEFTEVFTTNLEIYFKRNSTMTTAITTIRSLSSRGDNDVEDGLLEFHAPTIVAVTIESTTSILVTWKLTQNLRQINKQCLILTRNEFNKNELPFQTAIKTFPEDNRPITTRVDVQKPGTFTFQIKVIYGGRVAVVSDWSEPVSTTEEKTTNILHQLFDQSEAPRIQEIQDLMDTSRLEDYLLDDIGGHCEIGWTYNMIDCRPYQTHNINSAFLVSDTTNQKKLEWNSDYRQGKLIFTFKDKTEYVTNIDLSIQATINDTIYVHFVSSLTKGFKIEVTFYSDRGNLGNELEHLIKSFEYVDNSKPELIRRNTKFSITGKLPQQLMKHHTLLTTTDIPNIRNFFNEDFYKNLGDSFRLYMTVGHVKLDKFYSPIFQELVKLRENLSNTSNPCFKPIVDLIIGNTLDKIKTAAHCIKYMGNYLPINQFLTDLMKKTFILNAVLMTKFYKMLKKEIKKEVQSFNTDNIKTSQDKGTVIICRVMLTIRPPLEKIKKKIEKVFRKNDTSIWDADHLIDIFKEYFQTQKTELQPKIAAMADKIAFLQKVDSQSNIKSCVEVLSSDNLEKSEVLNQLKINGAFPKEKLPLFETAQNITVEKSTRDSITLRWNLAENVQTMAAFYKIYYQPEAIRRDVIQNWESIKTDDKTCKATVHHLKNKTYVFVIQVVYKDNIPGICSDISQPFAPKVFSSGATEWQGFHYNQLGPSYEWL